MITHNEIEKEIVETQAESTKIFLEEIDKSADTKGREELLQAKRTLDKFGDTYFAKAVGMYNGKKWTTLALVTAVVVGVVGTIVTTLFLNGGLAL